MYQDHDNSIPHRRMQNEMLQRILGQSDAAGAENACCRPDSQPNLQLPDGFPLASVFAPMQKFRDLYDPDTALSRGTVFKELDLPFAGSSVMKGGFCRG